MKKWILGIHHVAIRPTKENYEKTVNFYVELLGLDVLRTWGNEEKPCCMISTGDNSCLEILGDGKSDPNTKGVYEHLAFHTKYTDELIERVRNAGYEVTMEPTDIVIGSVPPCPARIAFCKGPMEEIIEFFQV
ncbi:VOC family protein [Scatolibacter rhodanostii]|uniref:VOC family protein n=1 Tax=Scatolibacter rhodanostii TaxID=2014781 RepID=UPI000C08645D|nr:VOC family protein [Scatolibacter rhodanostii]